MFSTTSGEESPPNRCGFDAILGNPPYVSIHTAKETGNRKMRDALEKRAGYLEDLYVHFTDLGFQLLREGGGFGFIVSDTFFTLASSYACAKCSREIRSTGSVNATPSTPR